MNVIFIDNEDDFYPITNRPKRSLEYQAKKHF